MINHEQKLYQSNKWPYLLLILFIVLNALFSALILNKMPSDKMLGVFIMLTIFLLLMGFLTAVKVKIYSRPFSYIAIVMGIFQGSRIFFSPSQLTGAAASIVFLVCLLSASACAAGGILSLGSIRKRNQALKEQQELTV